MSKFARDKGRRGEQDVARILRDGLGMDVQRNLDQTREGGYDITGLEPFCIEVKNRNRLQLKSWWKQTEAQAAPSCGVPVLVYKRKGAWLCIIGVDGGYINTTLGTAMAIFKRYFEITANEI